MIPVGDPCVHDRGRASDDRDRSKALGAATRNTLRVHVVHLYGDVRGHRSSEQRLEINPKRREGRSDRQAAHDLLGAECAPLKDTVPDEPILTARDLREAPDRYHPERFHTSISGESSVFGCNT